VNKPLKSIVANPDAHTLISIYGFKEKASDLRVVVSCGVFSIIGATLNQFFQYVLQTMQLIQRPSEMHDCVVAWQQAGQKIAFVPTMGNLHAGHLSLVEHAMSLADRVVVSIFVNPLQFNESDDFDAYPRSLDDDLKQLIEFRVDAVFVPSEADLYPQGRERLTWVEVPTLSTMLEGASRPGHFRGVATVVAKLFHLVQPQVAVFGEKDYQQLLVIRQMVADLNFPIEIVGVPTCRETDGLALSSRNSRLTATERQKAPALYHSLRVIREKIQAGIAEFTLLESEATRDLRQQGMEPEYVSVRSARDLGPARVGEDLVIVAAARLGQVRLIDNLRV
jgi:pantoate--beta-alanine ligase